MWCKLLLKSVHRRGAAEVRKQVSSACITDLPKSISGLNLAQAIMQTVSPINYSSVSKKVFHRIMLGFVRIFSSSTEFLEVCLVVWNLVQMSNDPDCLFLSGLHHPQGAWYSCKRNPIFESIQQQNLNPTKKLFINFFFMESIILLWSNWDGWRGWDAPHVFFPKFCISLLGAIKVLKVAIVIFQLSLQVKNELEKILNGSLCMFCLQVVRT